MSDPARKHQIDWRGEVVAVLKEERALLGKEDLEALVDGDLRLVGLNLAEVGINGRVEHEAVAQDELGVQTDIGLECPSFEERVSGVALIDVAKGSERAVRVELHVAAGRDILQSLKRGGLVEASLDAVRNARPEQVFVGTRDGTIEDNAPRLLPAR